MGMHRIVCFCASVPFWFMTCAWYSTVVFQSAPLPKFAGQVAPGDATSIAIVPEPVSVIPKSGRFKLTTRTLIRTDQARIEIGRQLARYLEAATGFPFRLREG